MSNASSTAPFIKSELCLGDSDLRLSGDFSPNIHSHALDKFCDHVKNDIKDFQSSHDFTRFKHPNITGGEFQALGGLVYNHDLTIKPADKGGGVVVMDTSQYVAEARRQLGDSEVYCLMIQDGGLELFWIELFRIM